MRMIFMVKEAFESLGKFFPLKYKQPYCDGGLVRSKMYFLSMGRLPWVCETIQKGQLIGMSRRTPSLVTSESNTPVTGEKVNVWKSQKRPVIAWIILRIPWRRTSSVRGDDWNDVEWIHFRQSKGKP